MEAKKTKNNSERSGVGRILSSIFSFLNSRALGYILIIILIALVAYQYQANSDLRRQQIIDSQNILAMDSIINYYKGENNSLTAEKAVWILSEKELKDRNRELYDMVREQNGQIISLNNAILSIEQDYKILQDSIKYLNSVIGEAVQLEDGTWRIPWTLEYNWDDKNYDFFKGHTIVSIDTLNLGVKHINTELDIRRSKIDITFGEKVVDGKYNVFITTSYPGLTPESMQGILIDPNSNPYIRQLMKKRNWFTGFSISFSITPGYDLITRRPSITIGPSIGYNIYSW